MEGNKNFGGMALMGGSTAQVLSKTLKRELIEGQHGGSQEEVAGNETLLLTETQHQHHGLTLTLLGSQV